MVITFAAIDYVVVAFFLLGILALGFSAKLRENSLLQFIAAGRRLTLPVFVATLVSTWYGGILGVGESVSLYGLGAWLLMGIPYYAFGLLYALVLAKKVRGAAEISLPERLETRFGSAAGLVGAMLVFLLAIPAAHVLMLGIITQAFTGWTLVASTLVGCGIGVLFLYRGGLLADARVSLLAFAMMYIGFGAIAIYCLTHFPAGPTLGALTRGQGHEHLLSFTGGQQPLYIMSFFILGAWTLVDPAFHQRVASGATPEIGRKGVLVSIVFWFVSDVLLITTGLYAVALLKIAPSNPLLIYPALGQQILPDGLKAVFVCGMLGTILTAMVSYTLISGATFGRDLIGRIRPGLPESTLIAYSRVGLAVGIAFAIPIAISVDSVVALWYSWAGAVIGAILIPVCISYGVVRTSASNVSVVWSMVGAFAVALAWMVYGVRSGNKFLEVTWLEQKVSLGTLIPGISVSAAILTIGGIMARRTR